MVSWGSQQRMRRIKEKLDSLARNKYFLVALAIVSLFGSSFYVNTYTARIIELKEQTENKLFACQGNLTVCEESSTAAQQKLTACVSNSTLLQNTVSSLEKNVSLCTVDRQKLAEQYNNVSFELLVCQTNYSSVKKGFDELKANFEKLANSSATNICCKKKIDDSSLKYFYIKDGILYCTSEASDSLGTKQFSCPSIAT